MLRAALANISSILTEVDRIGLMINLVCFEVPTRSKNPPGVFSWDWLRMDGNLTTSRFNI